MCAWMNVCRVEETGISVRNRDRGTDRSFRSIDGLTNGVRAVNLKEFRVIAKSLIYCNDMYIYKYFLLQEFKSIE